MDVPDEVRHDAEKTGHLVRKKLFEIIREGRKRYENALLEPHVKVFDISGRPTKC